jgi:hypothetical protein
MVPSDQWQKKDSSLSWLCSLTCGGPERGCLFFYQHTCPMSWPTGVILDFSTPGNSNFPLPGPLLFCHFPAPLHPSPYPTPTPGSEVVRSPFCVCPLRFHLLTWHELSSSCVTTSLCQPHSSILVLHIQGLPQGCLGLALRINYFPSDYPMFPLNIGPCSYSSELKIQNPLLSFSIFPVSPKEATLQFAPCSFLYVVALFPHT